MTDIAIAAAGAPWEPEALATIDGAANLRLVRRCVDVTELLAVARTGAIQVAVVDPGLPGLDLDVIGELGSAGVVVAACGDPAAAGALGITRRPVPHELSSIDWASAVPVPLPPPATSSGATRARATVVWGPSGAPGRTTVAITLASILAARGRSTALVDADVGGGTVAAHLGVLDDLSGILAACRAAGNGRVHELDDHLVEVEPGLSLLTGMPRPDMWPHLRTGALGTVMDRLAHDHQEVVVDVGAGIDLDLNAGRTRHAVTRHLLEAADDLVVVGRADPVGLTRLVRSLADLRDQMGREPTVVVVNGQRTTLGWKPDEILGTLARLSGPVPSVVIPSDVAALDEAMMAGRTVRSVAAGSPFVVGLEDVATTFLQRAAVITSP